MLFFSRLHYSICSLLLIMNSRQFQGNLTGVDNYNHSLSCVSDHLLLIACIFSLISLSLLINPLSQASAYISLFTFIFSFSPYICSKIHLIFIYFYVNLIKHGLISCREKGTRNAHLLLHTLSSSIGFIFGERILMPSVPVF